MVPEPAGPPLPYSIGGLEMDSRQQDEASAIPEMTETTGLPPLPDLYRNEAQKANIVAAAIKAQEEADSQKAKTLAEAN